MKITFTKISQEEYEVHTPLMTGFPTLVTEVEKYFKNTKDFQIIGETSTTTKTVYRIEISEKTKEESNENC